MGKAVANRDKGNSDLEMATAQIATLTAKIQTLEDEIQELNEKVAALQKALLEATELRAEDKAANELAIKTAEEGSSSVEMALSILSKFYDGAKFLQKGGKYVPPNSDRSGKTVGDLAPDVFGSEYKGSQSESKGIIGILEVINSDFERTKAKTEKDEKESEEAFEEFEKDTKKEVSEKQKSIKRKEGQLADANDALLDRQGDQKDAQKMLDDAKNTLKTLESSCVEGEETWQERAAARKKEIEALKEALDVLEDWKEF